jgi:hypothetical protein
MANRVRSTALIGGVAAAAVFLLMAQRGQAQTESVASDRAAGYVVFPKVVVDSSDIFSQGRRVDTFLQLTSTAVPSGDDNGCRVVECFYINATKHCSNGANAPCRSNADCPGGTCVPPANCGGETNFFVVLSGSQPVGWSANNGGYIPPDIDNCAGGQVIQGAPEAYFVGEVKCVEVDGAAVTGAAATTGTPILANELKGEATIYEVEPGTPGGVDTRSYNGIGVPALTTSGLPIAKTCAGGTDQGDPCTSDGDCGGNGTCEIAMCLGSNSSTDALCPAATHASCPKTLILNHFFDNPYTGFYTDLTLVPCSEDVGVGAPSTTAQFVVYNEFEQRFSASLPVTCFREIQLSDIDTLPGNEASSIFSFAVQGTVTGQTLIRPVVGSELDVGHGLLGVAEEFTQPTWPRDSDAFNLHFSGTNPDISDVVVVPLNP